MIVLHSLREWSSRTHSRSEWNTPTGCEEAAMIWLAVAVIVFLFGYLLVALLRPERF